MDSTEDNIFSEGNEQILDYLSSRTTKQLLDDYLKALGIGIKSSIEEARETEEYKDALKALNKIAKIAHSRPE